MTDETARAKRGKRVTEHDVVELLRIGRRLELAAVRKGVRGLRKKEWAMRLHHSTWTDGYCQACDDLLTWLKGRMT